MSFMEKLAARWDEGYFVCVGLDSDHRKIPDVGPMQKAAYDAHPWPYAAVQLAFNKAIVDATADIVCAYKPNSAFYEALGWRGVKALEETIAYIAQEYPHIPVILDAKRADIGNTNEGYEKFAFDQCRADAITVHPYLGQEALKPLLDRTDKGVIVLCRTSNTGAGEFQDLQVTLQGRPDKPYDYDEYTEPVYQIVARHVAGNWNANGNCAVVVGATYPDELAKVREIVGNMPILIPGLVTQGGEIEPTVKAGQTKDGRGMINNLSRSVIFASKGEGFAQAAREVVLDVNAETDKYRNRT